uniref:sensor histidine kinase n=1 Tax=Pararhizobium sp. IMCC3301 TaxID=3067904 RepID=UPI002740D143|nr:GAF domain-containing protein [Pararhizobium sp. IMCC3301]
MDHLNTLFDRALDAVVGMNHDGNVIAWNKAAEDLFGWKSDEAIGQSLATLIVPPQHKSAHSKGLAHYNETGIGPVLEQRIKITAVNRENLEFPIELSIFPMRQSDGNIFYAFIRSLRIEEAYRQEQETRAQEAEVLLAVATSLIEDISLEEFTRLCLRKICEVAGLDAAHLFHIRGDAENRRLQPSGIWYISDEKFQAVVEDTERQLFAKGEGLPGQAWASKTVVAVENIPENKEFIRRGSFSSVGLVRGIAVPIDQRGETNAVMEFFGTEKARFDDEMVRLVRTIAKQIGVAIERKTEEEERTILRRELAHRLGNSLTILSAIFRASAAKASSVSELAASFTTRLHAVARACREFPRSSVDLSLAKLLDEAFELLADKDQLQLSVPNIQVTTEAVMPFSLIFNELVTNHLKHGNPDGDGGVSVTVEKMPTDSMLRILWREPDSKSEPGHAEGYGSFLIRAMLEDQLGGTMSRTYGNDGFTAEMLIPNVVFKGEDTFGS